MTIHEWALLAVLGAALFLDHWPAVQSMASRPIVGGLLVGCVLGAPAEGALWGALFEGLFLAVLPVGAARYPDAAAAAIAGTAVAIAGQGAGLHPAGLAVATAIAAGSLGEAVGRLHRHSNGRAAARARERVAAGDLGAPGRATAVALLRGAGLGALQTILAVGAGLLVLGWIGGTGWTAPLPPRAIAALALAAAGVGGLGLFGPGRGADAPRARLAGLVAGALAGAGVAWWAAA